MANINKGAKPKVAIISGSFDGMVLTMMKQWGFEPTTTLFNADALVLTGGADISPSLYDQTTVPRRHQGDINRDRAELRIVEIIGDKPKIGICRGAQLLNVLSGGSMWQDVDGHQGSHKIRDVATGLVFQGSSIHHQMMRPSKDGEVFMVAGEATIFTDAYQTLERPKPDKPFKWTDTEGVYYKKTKSFCWQGHPETSESEQRVFFSKIRKYLDLEGNPDSIAYRLESTTTASVEKSALEPAC